MQFLRGARQLLAGRPVTVGASRRALLPMHVAPGDWFGSSLGNGQLMLAAVDVAFGSGR